MSVVVVVVVVIVVNSLVSHVISHVLAMVSDAPGLVDRFMLRVYSLSEYLLKYVAFSQFNVNFATYYSAFLADHMTHLAPTFPSVCEMRPPNLLLLLACKHQG